MSDKFPIFNDLPEPPARKASGFKRSEVYPFSDLEVGSGFIIPATDEIPEPWVTKQGTVNAANRRFAKVLGQEEHTVKKTGVTKTRAKLEYTRKFRLFEGQGPDGKSVGIVKRVQ